jgi:hypothetical protein
MLFWDTEYLYATVQRTTVITGFETKIDSRRTCAYTGQYILCSSKADEIMRWKLRPYSIID